MTIRLGKIEACLLVLILLLSVAAELTRFCDELGVDIVFTTGGTGLGPRDVTPEATQSICEKMVPGLSEIIRAEGWKKTTRAALSRAVTGIRKTAT